jgi:hypothetical protein
MTRLHLDVPMDYDRQDGDGLHDRPPLEAARFRGGVTEQAESASAYSSSNRRITGPSIGSGWVEKPVRE